MTTQERQPPTFAPTLACAMAERLCHDLAGLVGTLTGALELASQDGASQDPSSRDEALPLALEAGIVLAKRLRLARAAWNTQPTVAGECCLDGAELRALADGLPLGRRMHAQLDGLAPDRQLNAGACRLILTLLLLATESLAGEGTLALYEAPGDSLILTIAGPRAAWPVGLIGQLADPTQAQTAAATCNPQNLLGPLSALLAHAEGLKVSPLLAASGAAPTPLLIALGAR